jgi:hypothetical protein
VALVVNLVVNLTELERVAAKYAAQHNVIVAAGPLAAATLVRALVTKHKLVSGAVVAGGAWLAIREIVGPALTLIHDQFGYLQGIFGIFGG